MEVGNRIKTDIRPERLFLALNEKPEIIEFYLYSHDLYGNGRKNLEKAIQTFQNIGSKVYLHHPDRRMSGNKNTPYLDILSNDEIDKSFYMESTRILTEICQDFNIKCVIHCHYVNTESSHYVTLERTKKMRNEVEKILSFGEEYLLWENTIEGIFAYSNPYLIDHLIKPLNLSLVHDISHTFIDFKGDNEKLRQTTKTIAPFTKYLHVVDSLGLEHDSLELGQGNINWRLIKSFFNDKDFIFEIGIEDGADVFDPMIRSGKYFNYV